VLLFNSDPVGYEGDEADDNRVFQTLIPLTRCKECS